MPKWHKKTIQHMWPLMKSFHICALRVSLLIHSFLYGCSSKKKISQKLKQETHTHKMCYRNKNHSAHSNAKFPKKEKKNEEKTEKIKNRKETYQI